MPFKRSAEDLLKITGKITIDDLKETIAWLKNNQIKPSKARTLYFVQNGEKILYSVNQILKTLNNNVKNNSTKIETNDIDSFQVFNIFKTLEYDNTIKLIAPWNENGKNLIDNYRKDILKYAVDLGYELNDNPVQYTAIKLNERNFAEVHYPDKHSQIRIDIFYDRIPDILTAKKQSTRYDDKTGYSLNGKFVLCLMEETIATIKEYLKYCKENKNSILEYTKNKQIQNKEKEQLSTTKIVKEIKVQLNQILYGPPGTGKTYNTVLKAMSIIDGVEYKDVTDEEYTELKNRFDELKQKGQIEFVTFHQSYSYEEFVEGIKPYIPEWGTSDNVDIKYIGENGIFKRICKKAESPIIKNNNNNLELNDNPKIWKVSLMKTGENDIRKDCMENNRIRIGFDKYGETINDETIFDDGGSRVLSAFIDKMEIGDIVLSCYSEKTIDAIGVVTSEYKWNNAFPQYKRYRDVKWLAKDLNHNILEINKGTKFTLGAVYQLNNMSLKDVLDIVDEQEQVTSYKDNDKPYILIIDEINRGDVSKIFGELITLIEEDKRIGNKYPMKTTLPYSKEQFGVPNNLYIIGTMNTADRSIALLDTALRRRFDFEEIMPRPELLAGKVVAGINLEQLLKRINERITEKYDRDHQIGHSYLMDVALENDTDEISKNKLERAYKNRILPLLNEYFYNDEGSVAKILNDKDYLKNDVLTVLGNAQKQNEK